MLKNLLQLSPQTKHKILAWLGNCLHANAGRTKIWANQMPEIFFQMYASDAFFLNLGAALLRLCQPFCKPRSPRLLTFDPTYCAVKELNEEEQRLKNVHMKGEPLSPSPTLPVAGETGIADKGRKDAVRNGFLWLELSLSSIDVLFISFKVWNEKRL